MDVVRRTTARWLATTDWVTVAAIGVAVLPILAVAVTEDAGAYGVALLLPLAVLVFAVPFALVSVTARPWLRSPTRSGRALVVALGLLAMAAASLPLAATVRRTLDDRGVRRFGERLDEAARRCATQAVRETPDEAPGAVGRPRLTEAMQRCVEATVDDSRLGCLTTGCSAYLDYEFEDARTNVVGIDLRTYLDRSLRAAGRGPYEPAPQPGAAPYEPDGVWYGSH